MEQIKRFLREKGFALAMAVCLLAAAAAGVWAVRAIRGELQKDLDGLNEPASSASRAAKEEQTETQEATQWQQQTTQAANSVANVPKATEAPARSASSAARSASSGAQSGSGTVSEPSELRTGSETASSSAARATTRSAWGRILNAYSGDELVYNKTLGDWRTHNGTDYAASEGAAVLSPVAGKVTAAGEDGDWGQIVSIEDAQGRVWRLCGVADPQVKTGASVTAGQTLGKVGKIGCECAEESHIHVEVLESGKYLDPGKLLN